MFCPSWQARQSHVWIFATDGHSHADEGQTSTNLFFSKPVEERDYMDLCKGRQSVCHTVDVGLYQALWVMYGNVYVISISRMSKLEALVGLGVATWGWRGNTGAGHITEIPLVSYTSVWQLLYEPYVSIFGNAMCSTLPTRKALVFFLSHLIWKLIQWANKHMAASSLSVAVIECLWVILSFRAGNKKVWAMLIVFFFFDCVGVYFILGLWTVAP